MPDVSGHCPCTGNFCGGDGGALTSTASGHSRVVFDFERTHGSGAKSQYLYSARFRVPFRMMKRVNGQWYDASYADVYRARFVIEAFFSGGNPCSPTEGGFTGYLGSYNVLPPSAGVWEFVQDREYSHRSPPWLQNVRGYVVSLIAPNASEIGAEEVSIGIVRAMPEQPWNEPRMEAPTNCAFVSSGYCECRTRIGNVEDENGGQCLATPCSVINPSGCTSPPPDWCRDNGRYCTHGCANGACLCSTPEFPYGVACAHGCNTTTNQCQCNMVLPNECRYGCNPTTQRCFCNATTNDPPCQYGCNTSLDRCNPPPYVNFCDTPEGQACPHGCDHTLQMCKTPPPQTHVWHVCENGRCVQKTCVGCNPPKSTCTPGNEHGQCFSYSCGDFCHASNRNGCSDPDSQCHPDTCTPGQDAGVCYHYWCRKGYCVRVRGPGEDTCSSDGECRGPYCTPPLFECLVQNAPDNLSYALDPSENKCDPSLGHTGCRYAGCTPSSGCEWKRKTRGDEVDQCDPNRRGTAVPGCVRGYCQPGTGCVLVPDVPPVHACYGPDSCPPGYMCEDNRCKIVSDCHSDIDCSTLGFRGESGVHAWPIENGQTNWEKTTYPFIRNRAWTGRDMCLLWDGTRFGNEPFNASDAYTFGLGLAFEDQPFNSSTEGAVELRLPGTSVAYPLHTGRMLDWMTFDVRLSTLPSEFRDASAISVHVIAFDREGRRMEGEHVFPITPFYHVANPPAGFWFTIDPFGNSGENRLHLGARSGGCYSLNANLVDYIVRDYGFGYRNVRFLQRQIAYYLYTHQFLSPETICQYYSDYCASPSESSPPGCEGCSHDGCQCCRNEHHGYFYCCNCPYTDEGGSRCDPLSAHFASQKVVHCMEEMWWDTLSASATRAWSGWGWGGRSP